MKITEYRPTIAEVVSDYYDNEEEGVYGYDGKLNIRPKYQREFVYDDAKQKAVIDSILNGFPLNAMYWADNGDGTYEMIDGIYALKNDVDAIPTADVQEVKHGYWIPATSGYTLPKCSICGYPSHDALWDNGGNFCSHCGAQMSILKEETK